MLAVLSLQQLSAMVLPSRTDDVYVSWRRSILQRIGFRRRAATTGKAGIERAKKEAAGLQHHYRITSIVEKHNISESSVISSDQTPAKNVKIERFTITSQDAKKVGVARVVDKRIITLTKFLRFQAIYNGKTKQSLRKVNFFTCFSLSANIKRHINAQEVLKHLEKFAILYVDVKKKKNRNLIISL